MSTTTTRSEGSSTSKEAKPRRTWPYLVAAGILLLSVGIALGVVLSGERPSESRSGGSAAMTSPPPAVMPDLFGMTARDASNSVMSSAGLRVYGYGWPDGLVTGQSVAPGEVLNSGSRIVIYTTNSPQSEHPKTVSHATRHAGVDLDAPMAGPYDATFKVASKMWLEDKNGVRARNYCDGTYRIMYDTAKRVGEQLGRASSSYQTLVQNTAQAKVACADVDRRYSSGRWPGVSG